ncbi:Histidine kinase-, DNA gyrase B-, and HSP90-like ATPase [Paenibacillus sp. UNCCL117]|uniref:cache domain-containing sensor histidine kinase n=1 Tax=unclassified Paenibacillus TaxID=185978 RepID=UPI00087EC1C2|nr:MULTISPECIES: sensor histidine kinase [unclassified Paenibacillus]SDC92970.1 Histidine kinase-, DNA gyrase B-, and HSP90-like ATPase [Paenibacillus sp. cl123]SFW29450.1 Histidine kinase-, DNA gyrase B-, and HSP90-like ATPase [Paenibacillus sp. UNCCL117]
MNRLLQRYHSVGIATKQFVFLFVVTFIMFIALALNNLRDAEALFRDQVVRDSQQLIGRTNQYIDSYLDNVQNMLLLLSTRDDLLLEGHEEEARRTLKNFADYNSSAARTLYLISEDGRVFSNNQVYYEIIGNPHLASLYKLAMSNYGAMNVSEPYDSPMSGKTIAYVLPVTGKDKLHSKGVAVVEIDLERLTGLVAPLLLNENQTFTIISKNNNVITYTDPNDKLLPYVEGTFLPQLQPAFLDSLSELPVGVRTITGNENSLVVIKSSSNRLGWTLICFIKEDFFYQNVLKLYQNYRDAGIIWMIVLFFSTWIMTRHFTKPVRGLAAKMDRVRDLGVLSYISVDRSDEIGTLAKSYNAMMERVHMLLSETKEMEAKKKQFELKMLQSQIAPHFLYNTLACISSLARQGRIDDVRETIKSLVALLSFSFNKTTEFVTLAEELEGLQRYVQIQRVRYGDAFTLTTDVDPAVLQAKLLKLTLQPIVENAIFHGIVPKKAKGHIHVRGRLEQGVLKLLVCDNGLGMSPEVVSKLLVQRKAEHSKYSFTGMGVINVHERLRIHFGSAYGLKIRSREGEGTVVRLRIPYEEWEEVSIFQEKP